MAQAFYPPLPLRSDGQSSNNGLHELAASRWHSPQIALRLVVSYTTFSPLPHLRVAVILFCHILLSPIASIFGSGASCAARTFLLPMKASDRPEHCFLFAKLINKIETMTSMTLKKPQHCHYSIHSTQIQILQHHFSRHAPRLCIRKVSCL